MSFIHEHKFMKSKIMKLEATLFQTVSDWGEGMYLNDEELDILIGVSSDFDTLTCACVTHGSAEVRIDGTYYSRDAALLNIHRKLKRIEKSVYDRYKSV